MRSRDLEISRVGFAAYFEAYIRSTALFSGARCRLIWWFTDVSGGHIASIFRTGREIATINQQEAGDSLIHFWASFVTLVLESLLCSETSVNFYWTTRSHIPDGSILS
jgi:hypothetical protein